MMQKIYTIYDKENHLYFAGWSSGKATWSLKIESAHPYYSRDEAAEDYEILRASGREVMVEG
jgi:hypothetical protein